MKVLSTVAALLLLVCSAVLEGDGCKITSECAVNECCLSNVQPVGKREVTSSDPGTCKPLGVPGADCLMEETEFDQNRMYFMCPCETLMTCTPNGRYDMPLGPMGCLVKEATYDPSLLYFDCPCEASLTCKGTGHTDIPLWLGEMGVCA